MRFKNCVHKLVVKRTQQATGSAENILTHKKKKKNRQQLCYYKTTFELNATTKNLRYVMFCWGLATPVCCRPLCVGMVVFSLVGTSVGKGECPVGEGMLEGSLKSPEALREKHWLAVSVFNKPLIYGQHIQSTQAVRANTFSYTFLSQC